MFSNSKAEILVPGSIYKDNQGVSAAKDVCSSLVYETCALNTLNLLYELNSTYQLRGSMRLGQHSHGSGIVFCLNQPDKQHADI